MVRYRELFENRSIEEIERLLKKYFVIESSYSINADGLVDVVGYCKLKWIPKTQELPVKFNKVDGSFLCTRKQLKTLKGCPAEVTGYFDCSNNKLESLVGAPDYIGVDFDCANNPLISLDGFPKKLNGTFQCTWSPELPVLQSLLTKGHIYFIKPGGMHPITWILRNYKEQGVNRRTILNCQKALIEAGFAGNAEW
jgi:hypothetical protein